MLDRKEKRPYNVNTFMHIFDDFKKELDPHWTQVTTGGGKISIAKSILTMSYESAQDMKYTDSQIDDYTMLSKSDYLWKPPLRMTIRSRSSHPASTVKSTVNSNNILHGTAGFGFWNRPFTMQGNIFTLPESIWFFYSSPPSNMSLVPNMPGWGWKAQVIHSMRPGALFNAVPLILTSVYGRLTGNLKPASKWMQRFVGSSESIITADMTEWHTYVLEWHQNESIFWVDNECILRVSQSPSKSLGFVAWIDNEYAIASPSGELRFGKSRIGPQWLKIDSVKIEQL